VRLCAVGHESGYEGRNSGLWTRRHRAGSTARGSGTRADRRSPIGGWNRADRSGRVRGVQADITDREALAAVPDVDAIVFAASSGVAVPRPPARRTSRIADGNRGVRRARARPRATGLHLVDGGPRRPRRRLGQRGDAARAHHRQDRGARRGPSGSHSSTRRSTATRAPSRATPASTGPTGTGSSATSRGPSPRAT